MFPGRCEWATGAVRRGYDTLDNHEEAHLAPYGNRPTTTRSGTARATLTRWSAVLSGTAVGFAVFIILSALWLALAGTTQTNFFGRNLEWFALADVLVAAICGGFIAAYVQDVRGATAGALTGLVVWGTVMFVALIIDVPQLSTVLFVNTTGNEAAADRLSTSALWATFAAVAGGFVLPALPSRAPGLGRRSRWGPTNTEPDRA